MKVDLTAKPYNLDAESIKWVENTIESMTDEEKNRSIVYQYGVKPY